MISVNQDGPSRVEYTFAYQCSCNGQQGPFPVALTVQAIIMKFF